MPTIIQEKKHIKNKNKRSLTGASIKEGQYFLKKKGEINTKNLNEDAYSFDMLDEGCASF